MKIFFLLAVLANIIFFLWEINTENPNKVYEMDSNAPKQILLQSELPKDKEVTNSEIDVNKQERVAQVSPQNRTSIKDLIESKTKKNKKSNKIAKAPVVDSALEAKNNSILAEESLDKAATVNTDQNQLIKKDENLTRNPVKQATEESLPDIELSAIKDNVIEKESQAKNIEDKGNKKIIKDKDPTINLAALNPKYCYQVGPFESVDTMDEWNKLNKIAPSSLNIVKEDKKVLRHYMVYYPAAENIAESNKNVEKIVASGITDFWLFNKGEYKGAISLGLYDREMPAKFIIEKYAKMDIKAEITPIYKIESVIYSRVSTTNKNFKDSISLSDKQSVTDCNSKI